MNELETLLANAKSALEALFAGSVGTPLSGASWITTTLGEIEAGIAALHAPTPADPGAAVETNGAAPEDGMA